MHYNPRDRNTSHCIRNKALLLLQGAGHDCREEVRPLFTGIARVERLAWATPGAAHFQHASTLSMAEIDTLEKGMYAAGRPGAAQVQGRLFRWIDIVQVSVAQHIPHGADQLQ